MPTRLFSTISAHFRSISGVHSVAKDLFAHDLRFAPPAQSPNHVAGSATSSALRVNAAALTITSPALRATSPALKATSSAMEVSAATLEASANALGVSASDMTGPSPDLARTRTKTGTPKSWAYVAAMRTTLATAVMVLVLGGTVSQAGGQSPGLVGHWKLDNGLATDCSGFGNNGTANGVTPVAGHDGTPNSALRFSGAASWIDIPISPTLRTPDGLTITAWIRPTDLTQMQVISRYNTSPGRRASNWFLGTGDCTPSVGGYSFGVFGNNGADGYWHRSPIAPVVAAGQWVFVAATFQRTPPSLHVFVNGVEVSGSNCGAAISAMEVNDEPVHIGRLTGGDGVHYGFVGDIDDVLMFNRALSQGEILNVYQGGALTLCYVPITSAGPTDNAVAPGTRPDPGSNSTTTFTFNSLTIPPGGSFTLGSGETLNLGGGNGTLFIQPGAVFIGNGVINGNVVNAGLLIIPITQAGLVFNTTGPGTIIITQPPITLPGQPPVVIPVPPSNPPTISTGSYVSIGGSGFAGTNGGTPGGGSPGSGYPGRYQIPGPGPTTVRGTIAWDGQLDVSGSYTQSSTGVLRMFIAGTVKGETYSHLNVGLAAQIAGELQVVLQPELFNYLPQQGNTFDFIFAAGGLTIDPSGLNVRTLMTAAGASYLGVSLPPYSSGFVADPNQLVSLPANLFSYSIVGGNTLRVTLIDPVVCGVLRAPEDRPTCPTGGGFFSAVVPGSLPGTFQWQYRGTGGRPPQDWVDLLTGSNSFGGDFSFVVSSATAQTLTFTRAGNPATVLGVGAGGEFRCQITSPCGTAPTPPAMLSICKTDFNCDVFINIQDVFGFLNDWFAGFSTADFNGNGLDLQDIFDFLNAWFTGC